MRTRGAGATLALVVALVVPAGASAQSLRFVGPAGPRDVSLPLSDEKERRGSISVVIRNVSGVTGVLELRFFPDRGRPILLVGGDGSAAKLAQAKPAGRVVFRRNQYRGIQVTFVLPKGHRLSRVNGMLVAQLRARGPGKSQTFPKAAQLRIRGTSPVARFSPSPVTLTVRRACWLVADVFFDCGAERQVLIRGEDVAALPTEGEPIGHVVLGNGEGGEVSVELTDVEMDGDSLTATVEVTDTSRVGEFEGTLPLAPGVAGGPELPVKVTVGHSLGWAIVFVFLGAITGGFLARLRGIRRKRALLGIQVKSMLERYDAEKKESGGTPVGYDIDAFKIQPRYADDRGVQPFPADYGVSGVLWRIESAQDDQDFDEATDRTEKFIAAVDWWIRLEPWAREVSRQIDDRSVPPRRNGMRFAARQAFKDLYDLREELRSLPKDEEVVQGLQHEAAKRCMRLTRWRELWLLYLEVENADLEPPPAADFKSIEEQIEPNPEAEDGAAEARRVAALEDRLLDDAEEALRGLLKSAERELHVEYEALLEDDNWRVERLVETVGVHSVSRPIAERRRPWSPIPSTVGDGEQSGLWRRFKQLQVEDYGWTILSGLVAAIAYALTIWDETWGTVTDYATAFTAGFLTDTVVNWAILPAFQSYRARRRAASKEAKESTSLLQQLEAAVTRFLGAQTAGSTPGSDRNPSE